MADILYPLAGKRVWVAGHRGMVGSALVRRLAEEHCEVVTAGRDTVDLTRQAEVEAWLDETRPQAVLLAAAKVGVEKLLFLGSSCIYPKFAAQPISEDSLLTGALEPTNEWYAIAKIAGLKLAEAYRKQHGADFISAMPTNLYGPGDNFDLTSSHVLPALIRKAHEAKLAGASELTIWGSGTPRREFLHVDDAADAMVFLLKSYSGDQHVNVGSGTDVTILELAETVARVVGFEGRIALDTSKPDGTPRKLMSGDKLAHLGWQPRIELESGIRATYDWFIENAL